MIYDILLEHFSEGNQTKQYYANLVDVYKKWKDKLPLFADDITINNQKELNKAEAKALAKLIRRLTRVGFEKKEIILLAQNYTETLNTKKTHKYLKFINLRIWFIKVFNSKK